MEIVCVSDTHGQHDKLKLEKADVLVHAGDFSLYGSPQDAIDFANWLKKQNYKWKVVIAGNHDFQAQRQTLWLKDLFWRAGAIYLQDSEAIIDGVKFYGSPWTPKFFNWAFMKDRGKDIAQIWAKIPDNVDVLITHGPPRGILDTAHSEPHAGCDDLKERINHLPHLRLHVFGHLHEGYGLKVGDNIAETPGLGIIFVNAAQLNDMYDLVHKPIYVELR